MPKILMIGLPFEDQIMPMLRLAREVTASGCHVGFVCSTDYRKQIKAAGAQPIPYPDYAEGLPQKKAAQQCMLAAYRAGKTVGPGYDVIVYDALFFPGLRLARHLGLPAVRVFAHMAVNEVFLGRIKDDVPGWETGIAHLGATMVDHHAGKEMNLHKNTLLSCMLEDRPDANIVCVPEALQIARESFGGEYLFAFPHPEETPDPLPDKGPAPVVCIHLEGKRALLEKLARRMAGAGCEAVLCTNGAGQVDQKRLPEGVHLHEGAPDAALLAGADLLVTNGGMADVGLALWQGVPFLMAPIREDQKANAMSASRLGVASTAAKPGNARVLADGIRQALAKPEPKKSAQALMGQVRAGQDLSQSAMLIKRIAEESERY